MGWNNAAKKAGVKLLTLSTTRDFAEYESKLSKESTVIYLDNDLGPEEVKGSVYSKLLHERGYQKLFLATGLDQEDFPPMPWVNFSSKDAPWHSE